MNNFKTTDLCLAATLCCANQKIQNIGKLENELSVFIFEKNDEIAKLIKSFWRGECKVEPRTFYNKIKELKSLGRHNFYE